MAKRNRLIDAAVAAALFAGIAGVGLAQTTPKDAVANRQAAMKAIGAPPPPPTSAAPRPRSSTTT